MRTSHRKVHGTVRARNDEWCQVTNTGLEMLWTEESIVGVIKSVQWRRLCCKEGRERMLPDIIFQVIQDEKVE